MTSEISFLYVHLESHCRFTVYRILSRYAVYYTGTHVMEVRGEPPSRTLHFVAPGDVITTDSGFMRLLQPYTFDCRPLWHLQSMPTAPCDRRPSFPPSLPLFPSRGHGTYQTEEGSLIASVAGVVQRVNKLICVRPLQSRCVYIYQYPITMHMYM